PTRNRSIHRRALLRRGGGKSGQHPPFHRHDALWRRWTCRDGSLLWKVRLRAADAREVDADLTARCRDRSSFSTLFSREECRAQIVVRILSWASSRPRDVTAVAVQNSHYHRLSKEHESCHRSRYLRSYRPLSSACAKEVLYEQVARRNSRCSWWC